MKFKKDTWFSFGLIVITTGLLFYILMNNPTIPCSGKACSSNVKCCKMDNQGNLLSPWNFITKGVFHI